MFSTKERSAALGARLKMVIKKAGYTQKDFALIMGFSQSRLSNYITGARLPDIFTLMEMAARLQIPAEEIYQDSIHQESGCSKRYTLIVYKSGVVRLEDAV